MSETLSNTNAGAELTVSTVTKSPPREEMPVFMARVTETFISFLEQSPENSLVLEPMNSFRRREIHRLASEFNFTTRSEGDAEERHIVVEKTPASCRPPEKEVPMWNYGEREFFVKRNGTLGTKMLLFSDGTLGVAGGSRSGAVLTQRQITGGSCKVKFNAILECTDPDW